MTERDWIVTGVCPECGKRSITGGRCVSCGWESEGARIETEIDDIVQRARRRLYDCKDESIAMLRPTPYDWMTEQERACLYELELARIREAPRADEIRKRLARKRKARLEGQR